MKPLMVDLYCGLGGWADGGIAEGFDVIGFDIEQHEYGAEKYPAQLVPQDVMTIHGKQFRDAALIVASPPCQEFSYMAMPWSRAKAKQAAIEVDTTGVERARLTELFDACFRIQREAIAAAGHFIPMVVENVRGANKWAGRSRWNYGSFHLWGDVPALMPMTKGIRTSKLPPGNGAGAPLWKDRPMNSLSNATMTEESAEWYGIKNTGGSWFGINPDGTAGALNNPRDCDGTKQGGDWLSTEGSISRTTGSKSSARKAASARIAKIPLQLSRHIAAYWKPA